MENSLETDSQFESQPNGGGGEWCRLTPRLRWLYDKLLLADALGYTCGPVGEDVPEPGWYIVRPITNINGMGEGATIEYISRYTHDFPAGYFWCEVFEGEHLTVDYEYGEPIRVVRGIPDEDCQKWCEWRIVDQPAPEVPQLLREALLAVKRANIEFIGGKIIEIQFRWNQDFRWGNTVAVPVYDLNQERPTRGRWAYASDRDGPRLGFFIR